jgi:hypothetical protein
MPIDLGREVTPDEYAVRVEQRKSRPVEDPVCLYQKRQPQSDGGSAVENVREARHTSLQCRHTARQGRQ